MTLSATIEAACAGVVARSDRNGTLINFKKTDATEKLGEGLIKGPRAAA